jgi:prevent-host-death family protein
MVAHPAGEVPAPLRTRVYAQGVPPDDDHTAASLGGDRQRLGIREVRARLTSLVRRAGSGERIVVTIAGRPVAQLGPVEPASAEVTIDDLVARGLLEPARRGDRPATPDVQVDTWTGRRLDKALREVRGA